jgi:hypothetical protein
LHLPARLPSAGAAAPRTRQAVEKAPLIEPLLHESLVVALEIGIELTVTNLRADSSYRFVDEYPPAWPASIRRKRRGGIGRPAKI